MKTPLHYASQIGFEDIVQFLLDQEAYIDAQDKVRFLIIH